MEPVETLLLRGKKKEGKDAWEIQREGAAGRRGFSWAGTREMPKCMRTCSGREEGTSPFSGAGGVDAPW